MNPIQELARLLEDANAVPVLTIARGDGAWEHIARALRVLAIVEEVGWERLQDLALDLTDPADIVYPSDAGPFLRRLSEATKEDK